jgi:hypothetical protein
MLRAQPLGVQAQERSPAAGDVIDGKLDSDQIARVVTA